MISSTDRNREFLNLKAMLESRHNLLEKRSISADRIPIALMRRRLWERENCNRPRLWFRRKTILSTQTSKTQSSPLTERIQRLGAVRAFKHSAERCCLSAASAAIDRPIPPLALSRAALEVGDGAKHPD